MDWKVGLDRYLTAEPDYGFETFCEAVDDAFTDSFFNENEEWIQEYAGLCNKWLNKLSLRIESPKLAAAIIERAFRLYKIAS